MPVYSIIIDLICICIAFFIIFAAYRRGFLRSVILIVGYIASISISFILSRTLSERIYQHFISGWLSEQVDEILAQTIHADSFSSVVSELLSNLPDFLSNSIYSIYGGEAELIKSLETATGGMAENIGDVITNTILAPILNSLLQMVLCLLIFMICAIIVKVIAALFKGFYSLPIIGTINSLLGGIIGFVQALFVLYILGLCVSVFISLTADGVNWLNEDIIRSTWIFRWFYGFSLFK